MNDAVKALVARIVARDISDALNVTPQYSHQATFAIPHYGAFCITPRKGKFHINTLKT